MSQLKRYSVEFFPPKTEAGKSKLSATVTAFAQYQPDFFSVTYGAGGSTRDLTLSTVTDIQKICNIEAAPHFSCIGSSKEDLRHILQDFSAAGVKRIVALRGDLPSGCRDLGELRYANELVAFIRSETGDQFQLEVAAYPEMHPQANNWQVDLQNFKKKVDAGANSAITQYFYNADCYYQFVDDCHKEGINIPIIPGIMPITNSTQLLRFSDACGTEIPRWLRKRLERYGDDLPSIREFGTDVVTRMCENLLQNGIENLHFYSMNQSEATLKLWQNLNLQPKP
ncbi:MAG: methylenetetrahydrofolate reductase [NAD(P)H] [Methylococcales bacterium]|jgi:methylenetetrahydrofolate reductase (NADPH)|nr:methylenetetrahydrofolate reductase [NAD(P)H] [Methylococcales bacterium]MBT7444621.1 methylenetetrahydrofolate reductase [NAD(P)H] [Methylococcales bacterium]